MEKLTLSESSETIMDNLKDSVMLNSNHTTTLKLPLNSMEKKLMEENLN
jgi:hypothetical protein